MRIKKYLIVLLLTAIGSLSFADTAAPAASSTATTNTNAQQMLQQVKQLQQQQLAQQNAASAQAGYTVPPTQAAAPTAASTTATAPINAAANPATQPVNNQSSMAAQPQVQQQTAANVPNQQYMQGQLYTNNSTQQQTVAQGSGNTPAFQAPFASQQIQNTAQTQSLQQAAFAATVQNALPMSPEQIHRLKQLYSASQYAAAAPAGIPPRPTATSLFVDLSPGATPPAINLAQGDITALVFLDSTGAPWPIDAIDNGNPGSFNIQWNKKDNVLLVQATAAFGQGNLAVRLRGLGPPVMVSLITNTAVENGGVVDYRVDMRIPGFGPNANPLPSSGLPDGTSSVMLDVLDGIPPSGGSVLTVGNNVGQAWLVGDKIYLRTRLTLLSPGWLQTMSSADGTNAYQLQMTPMLLMSQNGKVIQVKVQGL